MIFRYTKPLVPYEEAHAFMKDYVNRILNEKEDDLFWGLEHPELYTAGLSAQEKDLIWKDRFPVYHVERGGQYTYHGPGQLIIYIMVDLSKKKQDLHWFVNQLEEWCIRAFLTLGIEGVRFPGHTGVWHNRNGHFSKIAAIGIRVTKWITWHGIAINVDPCMEHFKGIVPCGINNHGVTSLSYLLENKIKTDDMFWIFHDVFRIIELAHLYRQ
jgi:lipoyl(octanoyl) transferase